MCQLVCSFVRDNKKELEEDTRDFFRQGSCKAKSLMRYATVLGKRFQAPDALQVYLLARACNAHTRIFFKDFVWNTVSNDLSFYVTVNLAVVGSQFVLLCSHEEEMMQCVIGEIRIVTDVDVDSLHSDEESDVTRSDFDSDVGEDGALIESDDDDASICEKLLMQCVVSVKRLLLYEAFPTLGLATSVLVERLP